MCSSYCPARSSPAVVRPNATSATSVGDGLVLPTLVIWKLASSVLNYLSLLISLFKRVAGLEAGSSYYYLIIRHNVVIGTVRVSICIYIPQLPATKIYTQGRYKTTREVVASYHNKTTISTIHLINKYSAYHTLTCIQIKTSFSSTTSSTY